MADGVNAVALARAHAPPRRSFSRSHSVNWCPPIPISAESEALDSLRAIWNNRTSGATSPAKALVCVDLVDFEIYRSPFANGPRKSELISLHYLEIPAPKKLCFNGYLRVGNDRRYVQDVNIYDVSIEGYGDDKDPTSVTYLRSELGSQLMSEENACDVWYRLKKPAAAYRRYHEPFQWIAQFGKHVLDYLASQPENSVSLRSFADSGDFAPWLLQRFGENTSFQAWHLAFGNQLDFRVAVHAYSDYIYHQAFNLPGSKHFLSQTLWGDCLVKGMTSIEAQPQVVENTLATHGVCASFKDMYFAQNIQATSPSREIGHRQELRKRALGFMDALMEASLLLAPKPKLQSYRNSSIKVGDVVAIDSDEAVRKTWRNSDRQWLAYVHDLKLRKDGVQRLFVIWLYRPSDTNIAKTRYPFANELFFSDNCNCKEAILLSTDVSGKHSVQWSPKTVPPGHFVRQTHITRESAFVTFEEEHKKCLCRKAKVTIAEKYRQGDTVYITRTVRDRKLLDPTIIWVVDELSGLVTVRKLLRLGRDCADLAVQSDRIDVAPNELVLTNEYVAVDPSRIQRECFITYIPKHRLAHIPSPYNHKGAGDCWFVSMHIADHENPHLAFLEFYEVCFREPLEDYVQGRKMKGLSIFSGGGSLDRGIEEGGAVEFHTAVDFSPHAIHTQKANAKNPNMRLYCGSVDDFLNAALTGRDPNLVATVGDVEFLAAGSPCPGFSSLQQNFLSQASLRNASHISTFCSFVDLYRPLYGVLENVVNMSSTRVGFEDDNVLSNVVSCLVSMGYQVNQYIMDSWSYGSAQHRSRILITIAAPGQIPIAQPWHTHSKTFEETTGRSLGKLPSGERLSERELYPTPFASLSAGDVANDLPDIGTGSVQTCIAFPDHRISCLPTFIHRSLLQHIPKSPPGCSYTTAFKQGLIPPALQVRKNEIGRSFTRIKEAGSIPCITTTLRVSDARNGATVHWAQDRPISTMEARRAQNYPDYEPIIGTLAQQFQIVGNGVDRMVSFAFGLALRQAWNKSKTPVESLFERAIQEGRKFVLFDKGMGLEGYLTDAPGSAIGMPSSQDDDDDDEEEEEEESRSRPQQQLGRISLARTMTQTVTKRTNSHRVSTTLSISESVHMLACETDNESTAEIEETSLSERKKRVFTSRLSCIPAGGTSTSQSRPEAALSSTKSRHTRRSGHEVEFVPVNWNKRPEMKRRRKM